MLYLATLEPPVSAIALVDQIGSTYQTAPTKGLSKRGPLLDEELVELELDRLDDEELTTELELDFTLEEELTTELELDLTLDALLDNELDETEHPATTPNGAGCVAQVDGAIQLLPFS